MRSFRGKSQKADGSCSTGSHLFMMRWVLQASLAWLRDCTHSCACGVLVWQPASMLPAVVNAGGPEAIQFG
jgi:hypothetical protein